MKCYHCRARMEETDLFCGKCGTRLNADFTLIQAAAAGDQNAIAELYELSKDDVYQKIYPLVCDEQTALDLMQDTFVQAFSTLDSLKEPAKFRPWVKTIAHNLTLNHLRRKRETLFSELSAEQEAAIPDFAEERPDRLPEVSLDQKETVRIVRDILRQLPADQRTVIAMFYYEGCSVRQIAEALGISENTVKGRLFYGRKKVEAKVRELEKEGVRLYSAAPILFFIALWRQVLPELPAGTSAAVLPRIQAAAASRESEAALSSSNRAAEAAKNKRASSAPDPGRRTDGGKPAGRRAGASAGKALGHTVSSVSSGKGLITAILAASAALLVAGGALTALILTKKAPAPTQNPAAATDQTQQALQGTPAPTSVAPAQTEAESTAAIPEEERQHWFVSEEMKTSDGEFQEKTLNFYNDAGILQHSTTTRREDGALAYESEYDAWGHLTKLIEYDSDGTVTRTDSYEYDSAGLRTRSDSTGVNDEPIIWSVYEYDALGKKVRESTYNPDGSLYRLEEFEYDAEGGWIERRYTFPEGKKTLSLAIQYNKDGLLCSYNFYDDDGSSIVSYTKEYDAHGNLVRLPYTYRETTRLETYDNQYDEAGKLLSAHCTEEKDGYVYTSHTEYDYDEAGRLIRETSYGNRETVTEWTEYTYDENGNLTEKAEHDVLTSGTVSWDLVDGTVQLLDESAEVKTTVTTYSYIYIP